MKRTTAVATLGLLGFTCAIWLIWGARPFFGDAPLLYVSDDVPTDARPVIETWYADNPHFGDLPFDLTIYLGSLCQPLENYENVVDVTVTGPTTILVGRTFRPGMVLFSNADGEWRKTYEE